MRGQERNIDHIIENAVRVGSQVSRMFRGPHHVSDSRPATALSAGPTSADYFLARGATMPEYFIHFAVAHRDFRIPELLSVCECLGCEIELPVEAPERNVDRPFMVVKLKDDTAASKIASRCILVKSIYRLQWRTL